jgi:hypothetical protein
MVQHVIEKVVCVCVFLWNSNVVCFVDRFVDKFLLHSPT